ncbi:ECF transporter S component [Clostridium polynesiense]|uniref:ECF transporter S component n=1 Tax=Clostridium polynesiense TaxID=1325933 RepID=UPI00058EF4E4|nr:ECF transporter S component [Clostridium polynesiense]
MEREFKGSSRLSTRQMAVVGMLSGITFFMGLTRLGFIPLPTGVNATIMHLPVIIGTIIEGPLVGSIIGLAFGLFSMYQAFTAPSLLSFWFWNPIIALVPRVLIVLSTYYVYKLFKGRYKSFSIGAASVAGTLTNTIGVLLLSYFFYFEKIAEVTNTSASAVPKFMLTIALTNGIPEAAISALISIPVVLALLKIRR